MLTLCDLSVTAPNSLPTIDKACRACLSQSSGSLGDEVKWTYRLMLDLDDGTSRIKAALFDEDFVRLFFFPSFLPFFALS